MCFDLALNNRIDPVTHRLKIGACLHEIYLPFITHFTALLFNLRASIFRENGHPA